MAEADKVLLVDDEPNILSGMKRQLNNVFSITTATSGMEALELVKTKGPFAVIVADMRMPKMNGIQLLERMMKTSPDTTRVMLTGNADQQTVVDAVNDGQVFRFFTKPSSQDNLIRGIEAAIRQNHLITAERDLLQKTLAGSIKLLVDILSMNNPEAFGRAQRIRDWSQKITRFLDLPKTWELDMGIMLAPLGIVALPRDILAKQEADEPLTDYEKGVLRQSPEFGHRLLKNIPRMNGIANIVYYQSKNFDGTGFPDDSVAGTDIPLGARLVHILKALDRLSPTAIPTQSDLAAIRLDQEKYDPELLTGIRAYFSEIQNNSGEGVPAHLEVPIPGLKESDTLVTDLIGQGGRLYLTKGSVLNRPMIESIKHLKRNDEITEPIRIIRQPQLHQKKG